MNRAKIAAARTTLFVRNHRVAIAVTATAVICTAVHLKVIKGINEGLEAAGINPLEFHNSDV